MERRKSSLEGLKLTCLSRWTKTKSFWSRSKKADGAQPGSGFSSIAVTADVAKPAAKAAAAVPVVVPAADSKEDEEAARVMQRLYRGKLARTHVAATREREVMMSGKVNVKKNKDEEVTQLNDYKIGKILGQGAYGIVYKAHGPEHGDVAVKVLNRSVLSKKKQGTGTALDGVLKEIGVMKKLRHPNCVQLWEVTAPTRSLTALLTLVSPSHRRRHHLHLHLHLHLCRSSTILITTTCTSSWSLSQAATCPRRSRARRKSASHGCGSGCVTRWWDSSTCTPSPFCTVTSNQRTYCGTRSCRYPPPLAPSQHCRAGPR